MILDDAGRRDVLGRVKLLRPGRRARWGRMTAAQMVCHVSDSYLVVMGRRPVQPRITWFTRHVLRHAGLRLPLPWPRDVPTLPEVDQTIGGTPPGDFGADLERLEALVTEFALARGSAWHPMFGELSEWERRRWGYLHANHHLRQFGL